MLGATTWGRVVVGLAEINSGLVRHCSMEGLAPVMVHWSKARVKVDKELGRFMKCNGGVMVPHGEF